MNYVLFWYFLYGKVILKNWVVRYLHLDIKNSSLLSKYVFNAFDTYHKEIQKQVTKGRFT